MLKPYSAEHERQMRAFYANLSEKDRRRYAALEARKLPYGGISYLCRVLGCDPKTIGRGLAELDEFIAHIPHLEASAACHGPSLANKIRHFDRKIGYPMAWYFYLLKRDHVSSDLAQAVSNDCRGGYAYLPEPDQQLVEDWLEQPYMI